MVRCLRWSMVVLLLVGIGSIPADAQVQTGSILVKVLDEQQGVLPGVTITTTSPVLFGRMGGVSDSAGVYRFPSLPPGIYAVTAELPGFQVLVRSGIVVSVGQTTSLDMALKVGAISESVTVTGDSPVVDMTNANVNVTLSQQILQSTPGGRDIWSLLEAKMPGLTTSRPDVGGASAGNQATFTARGTSGQQNAYYVNGVSIGSPTSIGNTSFYFDYDAFEEIQVSTSAHDMSVSTPGVFLNMVTKTGGDRFSGKTSYYWEGQRIQSSNVDSNLSNFGFRNDSGAVDHISDVNAQLGGPIIKSKVRFFGAFRDWRNHVSVPGFPVLDDSTIKTIQGSVTYQLNAKNRLTGFAAKQWLLRPNFGISALLTPDSTTLEDNKFKLFQGLWNSVFSNRAFIDVRISGSELFFPLYQKGGLQQSLLDLSNNQRLLNAATTTVVDRHRYQSNVDFQYYVDHLLGGRHELRVGLDNQHGPAITNVETPGDVNLTFRSQPTPAASTVTLLNTPLASGQTVDVTGIYAQDSYTVRRLTITGGMRWERLEAYLPGQSSPPSGYFPNDTRTFAEIRDVINWKNVAPRVSFVFDLTGNGKTALKGAVGRYLYQLSTDTPNTVNKNFSSSEIHTWNDLNRDLQFTPNELGALLSRSGSSVTSIDPAIERPHTDEFMAAVDHELLPGLKISVVGTYRQERNLFGNVNVGVPFGTYRLVSRTDLGPDGLTGGSDDGVLQVWDADPATRGQDRNLLTNSEGLNQRYRGIEFTANKRFSSGWQLLTGYTFARTIVDATSVSDPNSLINSRGSTNFDRPHTFKVSGSYTLPHGILVGGNYHIQSGLPVARTVTYALTQGNVTVNATAPGTDRLDSLATLDARIGKIIKTAGGYLEFMFDGFNLLNANTVYAVRTLTGRLNVNAGGVSTGAVINQPQYLSPTSILNPRLFRLGINYRF